MIIYINIYTYINNYIHTIYTLYIYIYMSGAAEGVELRLALSRGVEHLDVLATGAGDDLDRLELEPPDLLGGGDAAGGADASPEQAGGPDRANPERK